MRLAPGESLSFFEILESLGAGGMGDVYRARDTRLDREVALKVLPAEAAKDPERIQRFQHEARVLASLDHPNIVSVLSAGEADGVHFLIMGLVRGQQLVQLISKEGMSPEQLLPYAQSIGEGLATAHAHGIIHRDLKPANIMVSEEGEVRIVDFGLAKQESSTQPSLELTSAGAAVGTIPYMSPEQLRGSEVDARSDIFSLGVVLFEMATGARPFTGDSGNDVIFAILNDEPQPLSGPCRKRAPKLEGVIEQCLRKDPQERYSSAGAVLQDLVAIGLGACAEPPAAPAAPLECAEAIGNLTTRFPLPSRPSLAVLPFVNLGGDSDEDLAFGVWFDLNAELVKLAGLFLLNSTSTATYAGRTIDPREIGDELGVRHLLQGTVRRAGTRVRITIQLVATESGAPVWANRFENEASDLFALQDEMNAEVLNALDIQLLHGEGARTMRSSFKDQNARLLYYRALPLSFSSNMEDLERARALLEDAERREPGSPQASGTMGWTYYFEATSESCVDPEPAIARAREFAAKAIDAGDASGMGHMLMATTHLFQGSHNQAQKTSQVALDHRPGCPWAYALASNVYNYIGEPHLAIPMALRAIRLSPLVPDLFPAVLATSYYLVGRLEDAIAAAWRATELDPDNTDARVILVAALTASNRSEETPPVVAELRQIHPNFSLESFSRRQPYRNRTTLDGLLADLRRGGL